MLFRIIIFVISMSLSACQASRVPGQFIGTWGEKCSAPFVQFNRDDTVLIYPNLSNVAYELKAVVTDGRNLTVTFHDSLAGETTDTYALEGDQLRLIKTVQNRRVKMWKDRVLKKCA